jgi:Mrp family chromosome partitioning ATPase
MVKMRKPEKVIGIFCCLFLLMGTSLSYCQFSRADTQKIGKNFNEDIIIEITSQPFSEDSLNKAVNLSKISSTQIQQVEEYIIRCLWHLERKEMAISRARSLLETTDSSVAHYYLVQFNLIRGNARHADFHLERSQIGAIKKSLIKARIFSIRHEIPWPLIIIFFAFSFLISMLIAFKIGKKLFVTRPAATIIEPISLPDATDECQQKTPENTRPVVAFTAPAIKDYSKPIPIALPGPVNLPASNLPSASKIFLIAPSGIFNEKKQKVRPEAFETAQKLDPWFFFLSDLFFEPGSLIEKLANPVPKITPNFGKLPHLFHDFSEDFLPESEIISDADLIETAIVSSESNEVTFSNSSSVFDNFVKKLFPFPPIAGFVEPQLAKSHLTETPAELNYIFSKFSRLNLQDHESKTQLPEKLTAMAGLIFTPVSDFLKTLRTTAPKPFAESNVQIPDSEANPEIIQMPDFNAINWAGDINTCNRIAGIAQSLLKKNHNGKKPLIGVSSTNEVSSRAAFAFMLGRKMAESGFRTLIIDVDFANPMLNLFTEIPCIFSLKHMLKSASQASSLETQTEFENLKILPSGSPDTETQKQMKEQFWHATLSTLFRHQDIILLILPPFNGIENSFVCPRESTLLGLCSMNSSSSEREFKYWSSYFLKKGLTDIQRINCQTN